MYVLFIALLIVISGIGFYLYYPGLNSPFMLDDYPNLGALENFPGKFSLDGLLLFLSMDTSSAIGRTVSILTFYLNKSDWPNNPFGFKVVNLAIHLACFWLIAALSYRLQYLTNQPPSRKKAMILALVVSAIWLVTPMQTTTVYYAVQRIAQLAALFSLLALHAYLSFRTATTRGKQVGFFLLMGFFMLLGFLSKENAYLIFLAFCLLEIYFFKWHGGKALKATLVIVAVLPAIAILARLIIWPMVHAPDYTNRSFTMDQRLLTQVYCLKDYFFQFLLPDVARLSVFHDDLQPIKSITDLRFISGALFIGAALFSIFFFFKRNKLISFGLAWYFAWHLAEASAVPLELYFEHRNYLPSIGIVIALLGCCRYVDEHVKQVSRRRLLTFGLAAYVLALATLVFFEAKRWEHPLYLAERWVHQHPGSMRAQGFYTTMLRVFGIKMDAVAHFRKQTAEYPDLLAPWLMLKMLGCLDGKEYVTEDEYKDFVPKETYELPALIAIHKILKMAETHSCKIPIDLDTYEVLLNRYTKERDMRPQMENVYLMLQRIAKLEHDFPKEEGYFWKGYKYPVSTLYTLLFYARLRQEGKEQEAFKLLDDLQERLSHHLIPLRNIFGYLYVDLALDPKKNKEEAAHASIPGAVSETVKNEKAQHSSTSKE